MQQDQLIERLKNFKFQSSVYHYYTPNHISYLFRTLCAKAFKNVNNLAVKMKKFLQKSKHDQAQKSNKQNVTKCLSATLYFVGTTTENPSNIKAWTKSSPEQIAS